MKIKLISIIAFLLTLSFSSFGSCPEKLELNEIGSKARVCEDGSVSFYQPNSYSEKQKKDDYESLCGAVAASNVFHAYCEKHFVSPIHIGKKYFRDITPGIRPDTLRSGLNRLFKNNSQCAAGKWKHYYSTNRWDFLDSLHREVRRGNSEWRSKSKTGKTKVRSPLIVLIAKSASADMLHYVTVVDIQGYDPYASDNQAYSSKECKVIYNDFGSQKSASCSKFVRWANNVDNNFFTSWMTEYIHFVFRPR